MKNAVPKELQSVLWSQNIDDLDKIKDKNYIIHQILSYGRMDDILWLFTTYSKSEIKETFITHPYKDYDTARFHFIKKYILSIKEPLNNQLYVKNTPRDIR